MKYALTEKTLLEKARSLAAGEKLPTFEALKKELAISQSTLDRALRNLAAQGVITKRRGSGIFVSRNPEKKNAIGVFVSDITNRFCSIFLKGVESEMALHGYRTILCNGSSEMRREIRTIVSLQGSIDALIVFPTTSNALNTTYVRHLIDMKRRTRIPFVFADIQIPGILGDYIGFDNYAAVYDAMMYLVPKLPGRNILYVGQAGSVIGAERFLGFADALRKSGIPAGRVHVYAYDKNYSSDLHQCMKQVRHMPAIVIAESPDILMPVLNEAARKGLRVPEDVVVVGITEEDYPDYVAAPIIALKKPARDLGANAARMAIKAITGDGGAQSCRLPIIREIPEIIRKGMKQTGGHVR